MLPLLLGNAPAGAVGSPEAQLLIQHPTAVLAVLATIFRSARHATFGRIFKIVPTLVFCYFVPTFLTTMRVIPAESPLYAWVKSFVLPASLLLLILALDPPGIIRLGPKAVLTLLSGTLAVVIGGLISLLICKGFLPDDAWKGMAALCGSWIGGGANMIALKETVGCSNELLSSTSLSMCSSPTSGWARSCFWQAARKRWIAGSVLMPRPSANSSAR